jgi:hypothetical protein
MFKGGQGKATACCDRWATATRHEPIRLLSHAPPQNAFDAGVLTMNDGAIARQASY